MAEKSTSPWIYLGCGCVAIIGLLMLGTCTAGFFGVTAVKDYLEDLGDPVARNERALKILGAEEWPEGYSAQLYFRLPRLFEIILLTDGEPLEFDSENDADMDEEHMGNRIFAYVSVRDSKGEINPFDPMDAGSVQVDAGVEVTSAKKLSEGTLPIDRGQILYETHQGELLTESREVHQGVYAVLKVECESADPLARFGLWFFRQEVVTEDDPAGTPADEEALAAFLEYFTFCS